MSSFDFVVYNILDGKIVRTGICSTLEDALIQHNNNPELSVLLTSGSDLLNYVHNGQLLPRPEFDCLTLYEKSVGEILILNLPNNISVKIENQNITTDGEPLELELNQAGSFTIKLSGFPYLDKEVKVIVNENIPN